MVTQDIGWRWGFTVSPNLSFFDSVVDALYLDIAILPASEEQAGRYIWTSFHFNDLNDIQSVCDRAGALKALFDGAVFLQYWRKYEPFELGSLSSLETGMPYRKLDPASKAWPFSASWISNKSDGSLSPLQDFVARAIFQSRYDQVSLEILSLLGTNRITWASLYAALEVLRYNDWPTRVITKLGLASSEDLRRFCNTANSAAAAGYGARHGEQGFKPPPRPMTITEAADLLFPLIRAFLDERARKMKLHEKWRKLIF